MCGRYTLIDTKGLAKRYNLAKVPDGLRANYNVAPMQTMPVVTAADNGHRLELMRWGIPRFIGPGKVKDVFNTRADKAFGSWKKLVMTQRLLVPASGFYEWKKLPDSKQPYYIRPRGEAIFSFAGLWGAWQDDDGREVKTYSILTTEPNLEVAGIHNRMPVILHRKDESLWLEHAHDNDNVFLEEFLRPYEDHGLEMYPVSRDVNTARVNDEHLIYPLNG